MQKVRNTYRTNRHANMKGIIALFLYRLTVKLVSTPMIRKTKTRAHKVKGSLYDEETGEKYTKHELFTVKM